MFVVTRGVAQSLVVGEFDGFERLLEINVLDVDGPRVRLGLDLVAHGPVSVESAWKRLSADALTAGDAEGLPEAVRWSRNGLSGRLATHSRGNDRRTLLPTAESPPAEPSTTEYEETVHDVNNILSGIRLIAEAGRRFVPEASPLVAMIEEIQSACGEVGVLLGTLLSIHAPGVARPYREPIDLSNLVVDARPLLDAFVEGRRGLEFRFDAAPTLVLANPGQVKQVLSNLVLNAFQAMEGRSGSVVVATGTCDPVAKLAGNEFPIDLPDTRHHFVEVSDTGCGMDAKTCARLFEPRFTTKPTGHGLGMVSVLRIVSEHGGTIRVHSVPGEGTRIRVLFPSVEGTLPEIPARRGANAARRHRPTRTGTLLLVDDDRSIRMLLAALLEPRGWNVLPCTNGAEAVERLRERRGGISAVVLDMTMAGMDGAETLRQLRAVVPGIPAIVLSGSSREQLEHRFDRERPQAFLAKPISLDELIETIERILVDATTSQAVADECEIRE